MCGIMVCGLIFLCWFIVLCDGKLGGWFVLLFDMEVWMMIFY